MTESQKAFEANYKANHHFWHSSIFAIEDDGSYVEIVMRDHFQNWQAAEAYGRKKALEELTAEREQVSENIKQIEIGELKP